jgi:hypothetical protein
MTVRIPDVSVFGCLLYLNVRFGDHHCSIKIIMCSGDNVQWPILERTGDLITGRLNHFMHNIKYFFCIKRSSLAENFSLVYEWAKTLKKQTNVQFLNGLLG